MGVQRRSLGRSEKVLRGGDFYPEGLAEGPAEGRAQRGGCRGGGSVQA